MSDLFFSIVVPTYNRLKELNALLDSLSPDKQETQNKFSWEVIVSDDANCTQTKEMVESKGEKFFWYKGPSQGPGANRNNASQYAQGEWLVFIDDDCYVESHFLISYYEMAIDNMADALEGKIICPDKKNSIFRRQPENTQGGCLPSGNFAILRQCFETLGGFDEDLIIMEDMEFHHRLKSNNYSVKFCERAVAFHPSQPKPLSFYWNWIFHFKWQLLLNYKCDPSRIADNIFLSYFKCITGHINITIRQTWHLYSQHDPDRWIMYTFERILGWLTMPITLAHLCFWLCLHLSLLLYR